MSKSLIYAGSNTIQPTVANGTTVQFPNIVRRYGCNLSISNGNVVVNGTGYFEGAVNLTIDGTVAGTAVVQVYENGTAIPYATASVETSADSISSVSIPFAIKNCCKCLQKTITVAISGTPTNITNSAILVEKE